MRVARWLSRALGVLPTALLILVAVVLVISLEARLIDAAFVDFLLAVLQLIGGAWLVFEIWRMRRAELRAYLDHGHPSAKKSHVPRPPGARQSVRWPAAGLAVTAALVTAVAVTAYLVRPLSIIHGPTWLIVKYPLLWLTVALAAALAAWVAKAAGWYTRRIGLAAWTAGTAIAVLIPMAWLTPKLSAEATYEHYRYIQIAKLPSGGEVRLLPREVAAQEATIGFNLSGHTLGDAHLILDAQDHRLTWSFEQAPNGFRNVFFRNAEGIALLDAQETSRTYHEIDRRFRVAPGMQVSDNTHWRIYKHDYFSVPAAAVAVVTPSGAPEFVEPVLSYRGLLVKYPVVSTVYVFHPDGTSERLSVDEAMKRPDVGGSGILVPASLAREIQDAYAYKHGIWNASIGHNDQTQIVDSTDSDNHQPYLMAFSRLADGSPLPAGQHEHLYWVSSAEPRGHAFATKAILLTDADTGVTYVKSIPRDESLTGANQAVQDAKSLAIPGIVFAASYETGVTGGGRYVVVEPRPVFVKGKLQYLMSIIPTSHNNVTKSVIVDAASNKVVALFNHDSDPDADTKLLRYLRTGVLDQSAAAAPTDVGQPTSSASGKTKTEKTVTQLLQENERLLQQVRANQAEIERLLTLRCQTSEQTTPSDPTRTGGDC